MIRRPLDDRYLSERYPCNDCGVDVLEIGDWYMARKIWDELGLGWTDNLCLACLEKRLGRPLAPGYTDIFLASSPAPRISDRLIRLWDLKVDVRKKGRRQPFHASKILDLRDEGLGAAAIAKRLKIDRASVNRVLRD